MLPAMMVSATCFGGALPRTLSGFKKSLIKFPISTYATVITELLQLTTSENNADKDTWIQECPTQVKSPLTTLWLFFTPRTIWKLWTTIDFLNPSMAWPQSNLWIKSALTSTSKSWPRVQTQSPKPFINLVSILTTNGIAWSSNPKALTLKPPLHS